MKPMLRILATAAVLLALASCVTFDPGSKGGLGRPVCQFRYCYEPQHLDARSLYTGAAFRVSVSKSGEDYPIEPPLSYVRDALSTEIESNGGTVVARESDISDVCLKVRLSRYTTRKYTSRMFKTFIDSEYVIRDSIGDKLVVEEVYSISGNGGSSESANVDAMSKFVRRVLLNERLKAFLASRARPESGAIGHTLDRLASKLLRDFEAQQTTMEGAEPLRVAFAGFKQDAQEKFSSVFVSSLKRYWRSPRYTFFSRDQLDKILKEQSLSLSAMFDETTTPELGKLKGVDYVICGNVLEQKGEAIVQAQIISTKDAEVVASTTASMRSE